MEPLFNIIQGDTVDIKVWDKHVPMEAGVYEQMKLISKLPFIFKHLALMPDGHVGNGSSVGAVVATKNAIIPSVTGVDLGCGMLACRTSLKSKDLPTNLHRIRTEIEHMVPVGFDEHSSNRLSDKGHQNTTTLLNNQFKNLKSGLDNIVKKHPAIEKMVRNAEEKAFKQIGSLGGGNHFIELCISETDDVWIMLHSGSRGIGNCIGKYFIELAQKDMLRQQINLPHKDLAYLQEGSQYYDDYIEAVEWAQNYASRNRLAILELVITAVSRFLPPFTIIEEAISCHHNYVSKENHFGEDILVTRKGAVSAQLGQLGIIPGSMGTKSFIVRGLGNKESFCSCSHGSGRVMSRTAAKKLISLDDHIKSTLGVECRKDESIIDESPAAYKNPEMVMKSQEDLVEIMHTLKQVLCVKG
jgi:tRNA-splicing ligase RtcB